MRGLLLLLVASTAWAQTCPTRAATVWQHRNRGGQCRALDPGVYPNPAAFSPRVDWRRLRVAAS